MKKILIWLALLILIGCGSIWGSIGTPNVKTTTWFNVPFEATDTTTGVGRTPDSVSVSVWFGNCANAAIFQVSSASLDSNWWDSTQTGTGVGSKIYYFITPIGDIDADSGAGLYSGVINAWFQGYPMPTYFSFNLVDTTAQEWVSLNYFTLIAFRDSVEKAIADVNKGNFSDTATSVDVYSISGDATAAESFETMLDGTGGQKLSLASLEIRASDNDTALIAMGGGTGIGMYVSSSTGDGAYFLSGAGNGKSAIKVMGPASGLPGPALHIQGYGSAGMGVRIIGGGEGVRIEDGGGDHAVRIISHTEDGIRIEGGEGDPFYDINLAGDGLLHGTIDSDTTAIKAMHENRGTSIFNPASDTVTWVDTVLYAGEAQKNTEEEIKGWVKDVLEDTSDVARDATKDDYKDGVGGGTGANQVIIRTKSSTDSAVIPGATVAAWNADQSALMGLLNTDTDSGKAVFAQNNGTYNLRIQAYKFQWNVPITIGVSGNKDTTVYATEFTPSPPPSSDLCTVYGYIDSIGLVGQRAEISCTILEQELRIGTKILAYYSYTKTVFTNPSGFWEMFLPPNAIITPSGTQYVFEIKTPYQSVLKKWVTVPELANWEFIF